MAGNRQPDLEKLVAESVAKSLPVVLQGHLASLSLPGQNELKDNVNMVTKSTDAMQRRCQPPSEGIISIIQNKKLASLKTC